MEIMDEFRNVVLKRHERLREFKNEGTKVVAYTCNDAPVEIIAAAKALPIRILSTPGTIVEAGVYVQHFYCHYMRSFLDLGLRGTYNYVDGFVGTHTCDAILSGYEHWKRYVKTPFTFFVQTPIMQDKSYALDYMIQEFARFRQSISEFTGNGISDEELVSAIEQHNTNRRLLRQLYALRKTKNPPISGVEILYVMLAGLTMPVDEHNQLLKELLWQLQGRSDLPAGNHRLMVIGGPIDESEMAILEETERLGGIIVTDVTCTGAEYFSEDISVINGPLEAIASRYLKKLSCPVKVPMGTRFEHILKTASEYQVQGVVFILEQYCDPHFCAYPDLRNSLQEKNIPCLMIETGEGTMPLGQIRNRVQAFLEMIKE